MGGLVYLYDKNEFVSKTVNDLLTGRLSLSYEGIQNYGIHLFGQAIEWVGGTVYYDTETDFSSYNYVDSSYIQLLWLQYDVFILCLGYLFITDKDRQMQYLFE